MRVEVHTQPGTEVDATALGRLFYEAVRYGAPAYTPAERLVWAPGPLAGPQWEASLSARTVSVASAQGRPVGFMTLTSAGEIDLAYILAPFQGKGLFPMLYMPLETHGAQQGLNRLHTKASLMARPAFAKVGFRVTAPETAERGGQSLKRFAMEKALSRAGSGG